jgi:hypothetical protein
MTRTNDKPPHLNAMRRRLEEVANDRPEPRFGARRTRKPRRPADARTVQQELPFPGEVQK